MQYMILIYGGEDVWASMTPEQAAEAMDAYMAYTQALKNADKLVAGDELQPTSTAKSVKVRAGKASVVDGPYVDTKETLGGYYLINADSEAEAIEWAKQCPGAMHGGVEVRPVVMR
ncbi:MAG TPA: YciI family protein [Caulobacterales bacterium]|nr:YciI family protein [Caulobacterales bacterium]